MNAEEIYAGLTELLRDVLDDDSIVIGSSTTAQDIPGWDSQAHIMLIVAAEQRFGVRFKTAEFESLHDVGEFVSLIDAKLGATT
jgi:acyl carrier protein